MNGATKNISVLVVDDEPLVRLAMQKLLTREGYQVEVFPNGWSALTRIHERPFDLVITDFSMPNMPGDELIAKIRELLPDQRIIMATAFIEEYRVMGQPSGNVDAILLKPFSLKELKEAMKIALSADRIHPPLNSPPIIDGARSRDMLPPSKNNR